ncbi:hypothetical protein HDA40_001973 [Hamadaea flava]|uniref:S1 family peptidase n=1 Tax=Hamadaea flava TaxID=1742688 RepID=A0ABV8LXT8_9ACTN|nr:S1 family peptidase [Hamadaea flava]MCP2323466.1 hypothetical protein [Hamadaea flava]
MAGDDDGRSRVIAQQPAVAAAHLLMKAVRDRPSSAQGFADIAVGELDVRLSWKGDVPKSFQSALASARRIAPVTVRPAAYSRMELDAAAASLRGQFGGADVEIGPQPDGAGVKVIVGAPVTSLSARPDRTGAGVPVVYVQRPQIDVQGTRDADEPYWWGAAKVRIYIDAKYTGYCTAGFVVQNGWGHKYLTIAGHCGTGNVIGGSQLSGLWVYNGNGTIAMGPIVNYRPDLDIALIDLTDQRAEGWIYDGNTTSNWGKAVNNDGYDVIRGEYLCRSGATTGAVCNYRQEDCSVGFDLMCARFMSGGSGSQGGDSGGPFFSLDGSRVWAKGSHTGVMTNDPALAIFQDMRTLSVVYGVTPVAG